MLAAAGGSLICLLGVVLLLLPVSSKSEFVQTTGWLLLAAGSVELGVGLRGTPSAEGRITTLLSGVTLAAAAFVLFRPDAYPLIFIAILCLAIRGIGALAAAVVAEAGIQPWVFARGVADTVLAIILIGGAPLSAVISVLAGKKWPPSGQALLGNFIACSMVAAGLCLLGLALSTRKQAEQGGGRR